MRAVKASADYASGDLLDVGCSDKPYESYFIPYVKKYIGLDYAPALEKRPLRKPSSVDVYGSATELPFSPDTFDTVLNIGVLEHIDDPCLALREMCRVLKVGGNLILFAPQNLRLHMEPIDYWRFTKHGLRHLVEKNGFDILDIRPVGGSWVAIGQFLSWRVFRMTRRKNRLLRKVGFCLAALPIIGIQIFFYYLDRIHFVDDCPFGNIVVAKKRAAPETTL
jgi:SAM-dependent methyltransferase